MSPLAQRSAAWAQRLRKPQPATAPTGFDHVIHNRDVLVSGAESIACTSCHQQAGTVKGAIPWVGVYARFPQYRSRAGTTIIIEDPAPDGPFGAKGVGEPALISTAPAILGGIFKACGARVRKVPVLPHRLRAALREMEGGKS